MTAVAALAPPLWAPPAGPPLRADSAPLPAPVSRARRALKHPRLMHYNRLIATVLAVNAAGLGVAVAAGWWTAADPHRCRRSH